MEQGQDPAGDLSRLLPDDVLADVLRRAAPRDLAVSRCVCRAWRALVDGRRLLRADLLPHSLAGIFIDYSELPRPEFFARPSIDMTAYRLPFRSPCDHSNGLVVQYYGVLNPATGGWTPFPDPDPPPPRMAGMEWFPQDMYLAFDPTVSSHYEVFVIPSVPFRFGEQGINKRFGDEYPRSSEWPPSPYNLSIFSSRTGRWEERVFVRENEAAGTAAEMLQERPSITRYKAVCWRGALYVHCQMNFIMRISLSDDKYRVIKPPSDLNTSDYRQVDLGKSEKGVYLASVENEDPRIRVWILDQTNWILKHDSEHGLAIPCLNLNAQAYGPWILQSDEGNSSKEAKEVEWNSDDETVPHTDDRNREYEYVSIGILAFHPYREIVFLHRAWGRGLAYHLNNSKLEDLGNFSPDIFGTGYLSYSFAYTPCLTGEFSEKLELSTG